MRFSRYHKYTVGTELRQSAMQIMRAVNTAVQDRAQQSLHVLHLSGKVDEYKLSLQLCMDIGAFASSIRGSEKLAKPSPSFHAFEQAANLAAAVGKQCGGWRRALERRQHATQVASSGTPAHQGAAGTRADAEHAPFAHAAAGVSASAGSKLPPEPPRAAARPASLSGCASLVSFESVQPNLETVEGKL